MFRNNKYWEALKVLILFSALTHLGILIIYAIIKGKIIYLNYFNILDIDLFFPNVIKGTFSQVFSVITMLVIYWIVYSIYLKKE